MTTAASVEHFASYLAARGYRHSGPRLEIARLVLAGSAGHWRADELHQRVRAKAPRVGLATVYRTLKLLCDSGLCREMVLEDGVSRYEPLTDREHHDHLICTRCGRLVEVFDPEIERLQDRLFKKHGFFPQRHRLELYGLCKTCRA